MALVGFSEGVLVGVVGSIIAFLIISLLLVPVGRYLRERYRSRVFDREVRLLLGAVYERTNGNPAAMTSSKAAAEQAGLRQDLALLDHLLSERLVERRGEGIGEYPGSHDVYVSITSKGVAEVRRGR